MTNSIRRRRGSEPAGRRRSLKIIGYAEMAEQSDIRATHVVGGGTSGRVREISGETCRCGDIGRSQSLHSTEAGRREDTATQPYPREGRQEGGCVVSGVNESHRQGEEPPVSITTNRGSLSPSEWTVIGRSIWTGCMLTARVTASKGLKSFAAVGRFTYRAA